MTGKDPVVRPSFLIKLAIAVLMLALLFLVFCGGSEAHAATTEEPAATVTTFSVTGDSTSRTTRPCYGWNFGPWINKDGLGHLRFGYGEDLVACTSPRGTRWVEVPTFQPYHWIGYWKHDKTTTQRSAINYWHLNVQTNWAFSWDPGFGLPVLHKERTFRCDLRASNHTASCVLYY